MHQNRSLYTLTEYQSKLRRNYLSLGIVIEKTATNTVHIFRPVPASPWLPEGRKKYFRRLRAKVKASPSKTKYTFATLTYSTRFYSPASAASHVKRDIDLFFKRLTYYKSRPQYFYVIELTDNMMVHVHIVFDRFIHKKKLFMSWNKITKSVCTKIKYLPGQHAMFYCLKYLTSSSKQPHGKWAFLFKNIDRLWSSSRNFFCEPEQLQKNYEFLFMLWNKNGILNDYFPDSNDRSRASPVDFQDVSLLEFDAYSQNCIISDGHPLPACQLASIAQSVTGENYFDFYTNRLSLKNS